MSTTYAGSCVRDGITVTVTVEVSDEAAYADQDELSEMLGPVAARTLNRVTMWRERAERHRFYAEERVARCECGHLSTAHLDAVRDCQGVSPSNVKCACAGFVAQPDPF